MPSLRRTLSSPSVRSSPYSNGSQVARGGGHRRSSGSETTNRRVLADIEWWKVTDGQCDLDADQEPEDRNRGDHDIISREGSGTQVDNGVDHPLPTSLPWISSLTSEVYTFLFHPHSKRCVLTFLVISTCLPQNNSQVCRSLHARRHTGITASNHRPPLWSPHLKWLVLPSRALASGYWTLAWVLPKPPSLLFSLTNPPVTLAPWRLSSLVLSHLLTACPWKTAK